MALLLALLLFALLLLALLLHAKANAAASASPETVLRRRLNRWLPAVGEAPELICRRARGDLDVVVIVVVVLAASTGGIM